MYIAEEQDSYESLDDIRRAILNSFGEKKLILCIKFHDKSRKMCTKQKNKSNITYMSKTIKPLVCCFRRHFLGNERKFLKFVDIDASIHNYGSKNCKGKNITCSIINNI